MEKEEIKGGKNIIMQAKRKLSYVEKCRVLEISDGLSRKSSTRNLYI